MRKFLSRIAGVVRSFAAPRYIAAPSRSPERLPGEHWDDYVERRKANREWADRMQLKGKYKL
ncbi:MAG: hypothetical protein ACK57J_19700 [Rubrivivax sp.]